MITKFEVGKRYKHFNPTYIYECIFVSKQLAILKNLKDKFEFSIDIFANKTFREKWKEYKEPIKKTWYADIIMKLDGSYILGGISENKISHINWTAYKLIERIEINWEEKES